MSRTARRGDDYAPATFPFLAVLLCTIGALVLILVISVVHSHASARRETHEELETKIEKAKEESDYIQTISEELVSRREKVKQEIERRRKELANVEDHIERLKQQMNALKARVEAIESEGSQDDEQRAARQARIDTLKTEIDAKRKELASQVERLKNRKPAFAIIPYSGANGTSRRPVYLECTAQGVVIQPEGIRIPLEDLKPPYGPGNPLDAALRVLRTAYQQRDATFGLTIPPYPLLVVRPDGIHSYAMARAAMSGWDDQYGYELIDADMDLVFPPGIPSLAVDLQKTLDDARKRQELLISALPRRIARSRDMDEIDFDGMKPESYRTSPGQNDAQGWGDDPPRGSPSNQAGSSHSEDAGKWSMVQELGNGQVSSMNQRGNVYSSGVGGSGRTTSQGDNVAGQPNLGAPEVPDLRGGIDGDFVVQPGVAPQGLDGIQSSGTGTAGGAASQSSLSGRPSGGTGSAEGGLAQSNGAGGAAQGARTGSAGASGGSQSKYGDAMPRANAFSSGNTSGGASMSMGSMSAPSDDSSEERNAAMREQQMKEDSQDPQRSVDVNQSFPMKNEPPKDSDSRRSQQGDTNDGGSIANRQGKGWATSRKDAKATPVSRPITIIALEDRWLIRKENQSPTYDAEIDLSLGPQNASQMLEKAIRDRVDSWGLSLPGGYWCPSITVEAASDAKQSVQRLQRLLEGSGVEIRVVPLTAPPAPKTRAAAPSNGTQRRRP